MIIDQLDIQILRKFYNLQEKEETTTWKIMLNLFPECKNEYEQRKKNQLVKSRIHRMNNNIFLIEKVKKNWEYTLIKDNVKFCKHKFPNGYKDSVIVLGEDNKWIAFEV